MVNDVVTVELYRKKLSSGSCIEVPVSCKDGTLGYLEVWSVDTSFGDEGRIRIYADGMFELEFAFDIDKAFGFKWFDVRCVASEVDEECIYDGGKIYLDRSMVDLIRTFVQENWSIPTITIERPVAEKLYDFITGHLDVVNDDPIIEQLMFDIEARFDLPSEQ